MKIVGNLLQKGFLVKYEGKDYYINYLNANYPSSKLLNRDMWEVIDENGEEVSHYIIESIKSKNTKKEMDLYYKLIEFCIKNFNLYKPNAQIP